MTDQHFVTAEEELQADLDEQAYLDAIDAEDEFLQEIADLEYDEFYEQEMERDERAREKAEEEK